MKASDFARKRALIQRRAGDRAAFLHRAMDHLIREARATVVRDGRRVVGWRMPDGSVACVKFRYRGLEDAQAELDRIAAYQARAYVPVRAYSCVNCGGWHLTSKS